MSHCGDRSCIARKAAARRWAGLAARPHVPQAVPFVAVQNLGSGMLRALHPFNGGPMLTAALVVLAKAEQRPGGEDLSLRAISERWS
ncbi:hypothetical protein GCM10007923_04500 [Shinella yambaruensis]|uniref:Uncharacterized protein n=1 Tax=Shinella yambaruensis TaxID=415996 RepID=A0ABQ5ZB35_9HYPH|nr:hypothetical protein GCM10007923_04500 [Shinella yambaruensis]